MYLKMFSAKGQPFCSGLNVLTCIQLTSHIYYNEIHSYEYQHAKAMVYLQIPQYTETQIIILMAWCETAVTPVR